MPEGWRNQRRGWLRHLRWGDRAGQRCSSADPGHDIFFRFFDKIRLKYFKVPEPLLEVWMGGEIGWVGLSGADWQDSQGPRYPKPSLRHPPCQPEPPPFWITSGVTSWLSGYLVKSCWRSMQSCWTSGCQSSFRWSSPPSSPDIG